MCGRAQDTEPRLGKDHTGKGDSPSLRLNELVDRDLCGSHLRLATAIYRSKEQLEVRQRKIEDLMRESDNCDACLRLRQERVGPLMVVPDTIPFQTEIKGIEIWRLDLDDFDRISNRKEKRREMFGLKGLLPAPELPSRLEERLRKIGAAPNGRTPASAVLNDGTTIPRVVFVTEAYAIDRVLPLWAFFVKADYVAEISESPSALSLKIRERLFRGIETSMSSLEFVLIMKDGNRVPYWYSVPVDFADLPQGYRQDDVTDIEFGRGLASAAKVAFSSPQFVYCLYR